MVALAQLNQVEFVALPRLLQAAFETNCAPAKAQLRAIQVQKNTTSSLVRHEANRPRQRHDDNMAHDGAVQETGGGRGQRRRGSKLKSW